MLLWESMYFGEKQQKQLSDTSSFPNWMLFVILNKQEAEMAVIRAKQYFKFQIIYSLHHFYPCGESPFVQFIEFVCDNWQKKSNSLGFFFISKHL